MNLFDRNIRDLPAFIYFGFDLIIYFEVRPFRECRIFGIPIRPPTGRRRTQFRPCSATLQIYQIRRSSFSSAKTDSRPERFPFGAAPCSRSRKWLGLLRYFSLSSGISWDALASLLGRAMCTSGIIIFLTNLTVQRAVFSVRGSGCTEGLQRGRASRGSRAERGWSSKLLAAGEKLFRRRSCCGQSRKLQSSGRRPPDRGRRRARSSDGWRMIRSCVCSRVRLCFARERKGKERTVHFHLAVAIHP